MVSYQSPEQQALDDEALRLSGEVNKQVEKMGRIIKEMKELLTKK